MRTAVMFAATLALVMGCKTSKEKEKQGSGAPTIGAGSADVTKDPDAAMNTKAAVVTGTESHTGDAGMQDAVPQPADQDALAAADRAAHRAGACPSTVFGATTTSEVRGTDLVLTIKTTDPKAGAAVAERAGKLLATTPTDPEDDLCPVRVPAGATATLLKTNEHTVVISITPKDSLDQFKTDTDGRIGKASAWANANSH